MPSRPGGLAPRSYGGDGGDGGGRDGDQTCHAAGGWGWGSGGCGRTVRGDGGGGGGGGGWFGGGGGGGACHGTGGGGGSGYVSRSARAGYDGAASSVSLGARGVPEAQDGWVVLRTLGCDVAMTATGDAKTEEAGGPVLVTSATWTSDSGDANHEEGDTADPNTALHPKDSFIRYRVGSHRHGDSGGFTMLLTLAAPSDIEGVSQG